MGILIDVHGLYIHTCKVSEQQVEFLTLFLLVQLINEIILYHLGSGRLGCGDDDAAAAAAAAAAA